MYFIFCFCVAAFLTRLIDKRPKGEFVYSACILMIPLVFVLDEELPSQARTIGFVAAILVYLLIVYLYRQDQKALKEQDRIS